MNEPVQVDLDYPVVDVIWQPAGPQGAFEAAEPYRLEGETFRLSVPALCDFEISPQCIQIRPALGIDPHQVQPYLLGSAMGALLHLRGALVFHGSAVVLPDGTAALFCGQSTAGKSTLAARLAQQGHEALADDISAVDLPADAPPLCTPGLARTKLWRDAVERLGMVNQTGPHTRVVPDLDKHSLPVTTSRRAVPVSHIYELQVDESSQSSLVMTPIVGVEKITAMLANIYRPGYLLTMGRQKQLMAAVARLAPRVQMHRIVRPRQGDTLEAILDLLQAAWAPDRR